MITTLTMLALFSQATPPTFELESFRNLAYYEGADADSVRHKLDIHVPKGAKNFPVVFFIHGGGWVEGNKDQLGVFTVLARTFARHGIGMVSTNYRLSPKVRHPEHIRDVARSFAWTYRNIAKYGGNPEELFVAGHSAGGHLCALLASDETYLRNEGLSFEKVKGAMPLSGLFVITNLPVFDPVFGRGPENRKHASPITHVNDRQPPFLVFCGNHDFPGCDRPQAEQFCQAVRKLGGSADFFEISPRNHFSILWNSTRDTDPVMRSMLSFILARVTMERGSLVGYTDFWARYTQHVAKK